MAIAAVVLHAHGDLAELEGRARSLPWVVDTRQVPPDKLAVTLESPSENILEDLKNTSRLANVWNLELVFVNYEEDLDDEGFMKCPEPDR